LAEFRLKHEQGNPLRLPCFFGSNLMFLILPAAEGKFFAQIGNREENKIDK